MTPVNTMYIGMTITEPIDRPIPTQDTSGGSEVTSAFVA